MAETIVTSWDRGPPSGRACFGTRKFESQLGVVESGMCVMGDRLPHFGGKRITGKGDESPARPLPSAFRDRGKRVRRDYGDSLLTEEAMYRYREGAPVSEEPKVRTLRRCVEPQRRSPKMSFAQGSRVKYPERYRDSLCVDMRPRHFEDEEQSVYRNRSPSPVAARAGYGHHHTGHLLWHPDGPCDATAALYPSNADAFSPTSSRGKGVRRTLTPPPTFSFHHASVARGRSTDAQTPARCTRRRAASTAADSVGSLIHQTPPPSAPNSPRCSTPNGRRKPVATWPESDVWRDVVAWQRTPPAWKPTRRHLADGVDRDFEPYIPAQLIEKRAKVQARYQPWLSSHETDNALKQRHDPAPYDDPATPTSRPRVARRVAHRSPSTGRTIAELALGLG